jgi:hypothetical protein
MIVVDIIGQPTTIQVSTRQIVAGGTPAPGVVTVLDEDSNILKTVTVASGGTANSTINNGTVKRSDTTTIGEILAEGEFTVSNSTVHVKNEDGDSVASISVKAASADEVTAPNGTGTARNSQNDVIGSVGVPSGTTAYIPIANSEVKRSDGSLIYSLPATLPIEVDDSEVEVRYDNNTLISTELIKAASTDTIFVPNPPVCDTLDQLVASSTTNEVVTAINSASKQCGVISGLLDVYPTAVFTGGNFAPIGVNSLSVYVNGNIIYVLNVTKIDLYNATTFAFIGSVLGFTRATEIAFSTTTYAVCDFNANNVRIIDIATNIEVTNFSVVTNPFSICFSDDFTKLYVAAFSAAGSVSIYNTSGVLQGTVTGFDTNIIEMRSVGTEYWVLTATGTTGGNTQRVRKMRFSDNTQVSTSSLGTVTTIGAIRAMVVVGSNVYIATSLGTQNAYTLICYDLSFGSPVTFTLGLTAANAYGLTYNPNICNNLIMLNPNAGFCYNILI